MATETQDKTYNGWKNYETWAVALWLDNEQSTHEMCREWAQECKEEAPANDAVESKIWTVEEAARFTLADRLKEWVEDNSPLSDSPSMYADLLNAALSEVDWHEVADHYLED